MAKQSGILALRHQPSLQAVTYKLATTEDLECWVRLKEYTVWSISMDIQGVFLK